MKTSPEQAAALSRCKSAFVAIVGMSAVINVLTLASSLFAMLVYDMILPSRNAVSLLGLLAILILAYAAHHAVEATRSRALRQCGTAIEADLRPRCASVSRSLALRGRPTSEDPLRDLESTRRFISSPGPSAIMDLPWVVIFIGVLWALHPWLGMVTLGGVIGMTCITILTERAVSAPARSAEVASLRQSAWIHRTRATAETAHALGMAQRLDTMAHAAADHGAAIGERLSTVAARMNGASRTLRMIVQSLVLATGAVLVIQDRATGGILFASSILSARALGPVDAAIANWKGFVSARAAWARIASLLTQHPASAPPLALPEPLRDLRVDKLTATAPNAADPLIRDVTFALRAGSALAIAGASGSGKTTLLKAIVGCWPRLSSSVRIDGAETEQWDADRLGRHQGWLPQESDLIEGTVAANVARFDPNAHPEQVVEAARAAGAHEMILGLAKGYDTPVADGGRGLSSGQRQRIGLARALYGSPFLLVLDEPAANLDPSGEAALIRTIAQVRARGGICIVSAHRPSVIQACDLGAIMQDGRMIAFGPAQDIFNARPTPVAIQSSTSETAS